MEHSYSCAMERSFLYHGRMYLSASHVCFHSNVFAKQLKVSLMFILRLYRVELFGPMNSQVELGNEQFTCY